MYSIKNALLVKQHYPDVDITVYYMDIRTPSKGYEEFYQRLLEEGMHFVRGKVAEVMRNGVVVQLDDGRSGWLPASEVDLPGGTVLAQRYRPAGEAVRSRGAFARTHPVRFSSHTHFRVGLRT